MTARLRVAQATADEPQVELAAGLRRAAGAGDYPAYLAFTLQGARCYEQTGRDGDALLTLSAAIAQLEHAGGALARPLVAARDELRRRLGPAAYARAAQAALTQLG